jgi:Rad3-related DNA helicase
VIAIGRSRLANTLLDIDIMKEVGLEEMFCPYFYPIQTKDFSNLFIMPYNYLLDTFLLKSYQEIIENSIIIFDEAHNVSEAACEGRSLILETHNFDSAILELNKLLSKFVSPSLAGVRDRH